MHPLRFTLRPLFAAAVLCLLFGVVARAQAFDPYWAHPKPGITLETYERYQFKYLLTEALGALGKLYLRTPADQKPALLRTLEQHYLANEASAASRGPRALHSALTAWAGMYPSSRAAWPERSHDALFHRAHELKRLYYELAGVEKPRTAAEVFAVEANEGEPTLYQEWRLAADWLCDGDARPVIDSLRIESGLQQFALRFYSSFVGRPFGNALFLADRDCADFVADLFWLVGPAGEPLALDSEEPASLEGTSAYLAELVFEGAPFQQSPLHEALASLEGVASLVPSKPIEIALNEAVGFSPSPRLMIQLLALATHNHGVELYLAKLSMELIDDPGVALASARSLARQVNQLYRLIGEHRSARQQPDASRRYHFWGGALVACELMDLGYPARTAVIVSQKLGELYETNTSAKNPRARALSRTDMRLHLEGAQHAAKVCRERNVRWQGPRTNPYESIFYSRPQIRNP